MTSDFLGFFATRGGGLISREGFFPVLPFETSIYVAVSNKKIKASRLFGVIFIFPRMSLLLLYSIKSTLLFALNYAYQLN